MMNYYDSLGRGRYIRPKKGIGDRFGSPPVFGFGAMRTWLMMLFVLLSSVLTQEISAQSIANYTFSSSTTASLEDLSLGATTIMTGNNDSAATTVQPIGFDFYFMGVMYTHFSANSNGQVRLHTSGTASAIGTGSITGYSAGVVTLAAMAGDNEVNNGMRMKVVGTSPNRKLVIEWNQFYANWFPDLTNAGNMQMWLNETSGRIDYVYGEIYNSSSSSVSKSIFVSSGNTTSASGHVTIGATPTFTVATAPVTNSFAAGSGTSTGSPLIANLGSSANGSRRMYSFTPSAATPANPTTLSFTAVGPTTTTPNWVDNSSNETYFIVTRATDAAFTQNVFTTTVASTTGAGTGTVYTAPQTGLNADQLYYYKVQATTEAAQPSTGITGSQATTPGVTYYWVGASGGAFATAANWNTAADGSGSVRGAVDPTDILIVDGAGTTPGGSMSINVDLANFTVGQFKVTSNTELTLQSNNTTTRTITISGGGGDDFVIGSGSTLNLTHATQAVAFAFSGSNNTGSIAGIYNASGSTSNTISTTGGTGTLVTVTGSVNNSLLSASGCLGGSTATLNFANGSNYTHSSFTTTNALLPSATWGASSNIFITGGTTSTGMTNASQTFGNFTYNSATSTGTMSVWTTGTTAVIQGNLNILNTNTGIFRATTSGTLTVNGNVNITGGNLQVGNAAAGNMVVLGNTTIGAAGTMNINAGTYWQKGTTFTNNGTLTGVAANCNLNFNSPTNIAQTFAGSGTITTNIGALGVTNTNGLTITHANQIPVLRVNLFNGVITNSNKITMGTGAALAVVGQIGYAGNTAAGGSFDVSPTWNLGTGTYTFFYAEESGNRTTGFEVSPARVFTTATYSNPNGLTIAGGNLSIGTFNMSANAGNVNTSAANVLTITGTTVNSLSRTLPTGYINGPLALTLPASLATGSTYTFPIGKGTLNSFALVNPTTAAGGTVIVQAEVFDANSGGTPGNLMASLNTNRYWAASITSGAANFTNANIQLNDTPGTADGIAASATQNGTYDLAGGVSATVNATSITTGSPETSLPGFFVMGSKTSAELTNLAISPTGNQCTSVARTVTVTVTPGGAAITGVAINYSVDGVAKTPIAMSNTSGNDWSGTIPTVSPANATVTWSVTATDANLITKTQNGTAYQDSPAFGYVATAVSSKASLCQGASTTLTADVSKGGTFTLGAGTTTPVSYEGVFYHLFGGVKIQFIVPASELIAAGLHAGGITSLAINIATAGNASYAGFGVGLAQTNAISNMSGGLYTGSMTQVYSNLSETISATGFKTFTFSAPFNWDGTSNLIVQFCWSNNNGGGTSSFAAGDTTSYVSGAYFRADSNAPEVLCSSTSLTDVRSFRPQLRFGSRTTPAISSYSWKDSNDNVVGTTNPLTIVPVGSGAYTVTAIMDGCPITATTTSVTVNPIPTAPTGTDSAHCGDQVATASVSDPNAIPGAVFNWYTDNVTATALQSSTSTTYLPSVDGTTTFYVSVTNPATSCESSRTPVTVTVTVPDAVSANANDTSICLGDSVTLTSANTAGSPTQNYSYSWSSTAGSGATTPVAGDSVIITPTAAGTYTYTVTALDGGCIASNTVNVTVNALPPITIDIAPAPICQGSTITLNATSGTQTVGNFAIGAGATTLSGASTNGNPYNHWYGGMKTQYIYTKAELNAAGITAGNISSLAFETTALGSTLNMSNFTIHIGHTTQSTAITTLITSGLTQVYANASQGVTLGVNTYNFSTPFNWNDTNNIVVSICWSTVDGGSTAQTATTKSDVLASNRTSMIYADATAASALLTASDNTSSGIGSTSSTTVSANRPRIVFNAVSGVDNTNNYTWVWNPGNISGNSISVSPASTTVYTVAATSIASGCVAEKNVTVTVNSQPLALVGSNSAQCGAGVPTASVSDPNGFASPVIKWYSAPTGGTLLQSGTSNTYGTSIAATTDFYVSVVNPATGCESARTHVAAAFTPAAIIDVTPSTLTPCEDTTFSLGASSANGDYVYTWTASPVAGSGIATSMTGASINVTPTAGGTYVYTVTGDDGDCVNTSTVSITVIAPTITASALPATICAGSNTVLTGTGFAIQPGAAIAVGAGALTSSGSGDSSPATFSNPFMHWYGGLKQQYIIRASELTAAGLAAGNITALAFDVTTAGITYNGFSMRIGHTASTTSGTTFIASGMTAVFSGDLAVTSTGLKTLTFNTPFNWDGTSNIVIQLCWSNNNGGGSIAGSAEVKYDTTSFASCTYLRRDNATPAVVCGEVTGATTNARPKMIFSGVGPTDNTNSLTWVWNPGNLSGNEVTVTPTSTTVYTVSAFDPATGCTATKDVTVTVNELPTAPAGTDSAQCGPGIPTASVADTNGFTTPIFKWYADNVTTTALQSGTSATYNTSISATTTFYVSVTNPTTSCESLRTPVVATYTTPEAIVRNPGASVTGCMNQPLAMSVSSSNAAYVYTWTASPSAGSGIATSVTGASPSITPTAPGTYVYTISALGGGCNTSTTITATINVTPSAIVIGQAGGSCLGQVITLTANGGDAPSNVVVGTGTSLNSTTSFPAPYTNYWGGTKHQMLIRASELTALGMAAGTPITTIGMNVSAVGSSFSGSLQNFQIRMKATSSTFLSESSFEPGMNLVYGPTNQSIPTSGLPATVNHTLASPFIWDGVSNIVIQTSYSNGNTGTVNDNVQMTNTDAGFVSTNWYRTDGATAADVLAATTPSSSDSVRPNITLGYASTVATTWAPATGLYTDALATVAYNGESVKVVYAKPLTATTYTVTASLGACSSSESVSLTPTALPEFSIAPATICSGGTGAVLTVTSGEANSYTWSPTTGLSPASGPVVTANPSVTTTYTVTATNNTTGCQSQETVTVTVNDAVVINSVNPLINSVIPGPAQFVVDASGTGLSYQWYESQDGGGAWDLIPGATSATLNLTATVDMNGFMYQAEVFGATPCGSEMSEAATLNVDTTGVTGPDSQVVCEPNTAQFTVAGTSENPEEVFDYAWEVKMPSDPEFTPVVDGMNNTILGYNFTGATNGTLTIVNTDTGIDGLIVQCLVNGFLYSNQATLTVNRPIVITTPTIADKEVCAGTNVATFTVGATGDDLHYQWQVSTNGGSVWNNLSNGSGVSGATTTTLTLTNMPPAASGNQYRAIVTGATVCLPATSDVAVFTVHNPVIATHPVATPVVAGSSSNLTVVATGAATYQWQYATAAGGPWANVVNGTPANFTYSGANTATLTVSASSSATTGGGRWYRAVVSSGSCSVNSNAAQVTVSAYCTTGLTSSGGVSDSISNVVITNTTTSANFTQASSGASPWYTFYQNTPLDVTQGQNMSVAITFGSDGTQWSAAWVDFNRNGTFEASENVGLATASAGSGSTVTYNFTVPMTATPGITRIRVRGAGDSAYTAGGACTSQSWGETEDYQLNILQAPVCSGTPVVGTVTSSGAICQSGTATLTVAGYSAGVTGVTLQWYDGATNLAIPTATLPTFTTPTLTASHNYYVRVTCGGSGLFADTALFTVVVNAPQVLTTAPASRCGAGAVTLGATATAGADLNWYAAATGGTPLFTGANFTTPVIVGTTNYYVSANLDGSTFNAGRPAPTSTSSTTPSSYGLVFNATTGFTLNSVDVYPNGSAGTMIVQLQSSSGTPITTSGTINVPAGNGGTPHTVSLGWNIPVGTGYRILVTSGTANMVRESSVGGFPYAIGSAGSITSGYISGTSTTYYYLYNWNVSTGCSSARTAVTATVTPAPALTLSGASTTICAGSATVTPLTVTSNAADFDTYVWSPSTGVSGSIGAGYIFNPASTTTYTLTATNTTSGCSNIATYTVTVNPIPEAISITPASPSICTDGPSILLGLSRTNPTPVGGCLDAVNGQFPASAYTPTNCNGTVNSIVTNAWTGEYSLVNVSAGNKYTFTSTGAGDHVTISDAAGTTILAAGPSPITWISDAVDQVRFYSQKEDCAPENISRTRSVICQPMPGAVFSPTTGLYTNAAGTIAYTGTVVQQVYAKPLADTAYTATVTVNGCSASASTTVVVKPVPTAVAPATMDLCAGALTTAIPLVGSPSGVTFDITGGSSVGLANQVGVVNIPAFTAVQGTATVTVTPKSNGCAGTPVTFVIKVSPATVGGNVTGGSTIAAGQTSGLLTLAGHTGNVIRWESSVSPFSVWTPIVHSGTTYTSGVLNQTTQFRAVLQSGTCQEVASGFTTVDVVGMTFTSVTAAPVCKNTEAVVTLNGLVLNSTSTIEYTQSGVAQTPVSVVANEFGRATFNVMVTGAGQNIVLTKITRTDVVPNIEFTPTSGNSVTFVISAQCTVVQTCGVTLSSIDTPIVASIVSNAQGYRWRVTPLTGTNTGVAMTLDTQLRTMKLIQFVNYAYATQYQIEVATLRAGVWGPYSVNCTVTTPSPVTSLKNCNQTLSSISDIVYADLVPFATGYRFKITDPLNGANTQELDRSLRDFRMNLITNFTVQYGKSYNVQIAVRNTDGTYLPYGPVCSVTTPVFPTTSLTDAHCDDYAAPSNTSQILAFSYPGVIAYAFQLTGPGLPVDGIEVVNNLRTFSLSQFSGLSAGATYNVRVRLIFDINDQPGPYGKTCTIITPGLSRVMETAVKFNAVAFPNPFAENFKIDVTTSLDSNINVKVYDMTGRLLETRDVKVSDVESFQVGDRYPSGVYNVIVTQGENVKTLRVIKR